MAVVELVLLLCARTHTKHSMVAPFPFLQSFPLADLQPATFVLDISEWLLDRLQLLRDICGHRHVCGHRQV